MIDDKDDGDDTNAVTFDDKDSYFFCFSVQ